MRRPRFRLRTLLIVVAIAGVVSGGIASLIRAEGEPLVPMAVPLLIMLVPLCPILIPVLGAAATDRDHRASASRALGRLIASIAIGLIASAGVLAGLGLWFSEGHGAPLSRLARIRPGMTRSRMAELLGRPSTIRRSPDGSESWYYTRWTWCQVKVDLTPAGSVRGFDHEH